MSRARLRQRSRRAAALLLCAAVAAGCSAEQRVARHRERAETLAAKGDATGAALELRAALEILPEDPDLSLRLATILENAGDWEQALSFREQAYRRAPERSDIALALARSAFARDPARAGSIVDGVIHREPELVAAHLLRSEIALSLGEVVPARDAAERALALAPGDADAHLARARARFAALALRRRQREAVEDAAFAEVAADLDAVLAGGSGDTQARGRAVRARLLAAWPGHEKEAGAAYREWIAAAFASPDVADRVAAVRAAASHAIRTGNDELRRFALEKAVEAEPARERAWRELARSEERAGRPIDPVLERLRAARPNDPGAAILHAQILFERSRVDEAVRVLEDAAGASPDAPEILERLSHILFDSERSTEGEQVLARLQREHPDAPATHQARAREAVRAGRGAEALALLEHLATGHETVEIQALLAAAYFQTGRIEAASEAIARAKEMGGRFDPRVLRIELRVDEAAGRFAKVLIDLRDLRAQGVEPDAGELAIGAAALYEVGSPVLARRVLEEVLGRPDPPSLAALEFARREGAREPARAAQLLEQALARAPGDVRLLVALAASDAAQGDVERGLARLASAPSADSPAIALERARLLASAGRNEVARAELAALLERVPGMRPALDLLVAIHRREDTLDAAVTTLAASAERGELTPAARLLLPRLAAAAGRRDLARAELERAIAENADPSGARRDLAALLADEGAELPRASELAKEARAALPADPEAARVLGTVLLRQGDADAALVELEAARTLARGRADAGIESARGAALAALGRKDEARRAFEAALRAEPERRDARDGLARLSDG